MYGARTPRHGVIVRHGAKLRYAAGELAVVGTALAVDLFGWQGREVLRNGHLLPLWVIPAVSVVIYPLLVARRRRPVAVYSVHWTWCALSAWALPYTDPLAALLIALHTVARRREIRVSAPALLLCMVPFGIESYEAAAYTAAEPTRNGTFTQSLVLPLLFYLVVSVSVWSLGLFRRHADEKVRLSEQRQSEVAATAVRDERLRVARELHDIVSHAVTTIILQAAGARRSAGTDAGQTDRVLEVIESAGVQAMHELHRLLGLLRSDQHDPDTAVELQPGLDDLAELVRFSRSAGLRVDLVVQGRAAALDRSVDTAAYRVVQESLTNAGKHNGGAVSVHIRCLWTEGRPVLLVRNALRRAGVPPETATVSSGRGLIGLTERVRLVGGTLEAGAEENEFVVRAEFPAGAVVR